MATEVKVPDIGDFDDVPVVSVLVAVGDTVAKEDPLIELEMRQGDDGGAVARPPARSRRSRSERGRQGLARAR